MKKTFYEKIGKRYYPVREYDSDFYESFPKGSHLVICTSGGRITRCNIDPAIAPMLAAGQSIEGAMAKAQEFFHASVHNVAVTEHHKAAC